MLPCRGPGGPLRGSPTPAAAQLAALKQCSPKTPESAALLGHARRRVTISEKTFKLLYTGQDTEKQSSTYFLKNGVRKFGRWGNDETLLGSHSPVTDRV